MSTTARMPPPPRLPEEMFEENDENGLHPLVNQQTAKDVWWSLITFRCVNALLVWTFFQPDEYFQSLEPAWQMAFGSQSGAWITWASFLSPTDFTSISNNVQEWEYQLRSSLHPALFAAIYYVVNKPMELLGFFPQFQAMILARLPNITQGVFAAFGDYYTWKLAEKMYGLGSDNAWAAVSYALQIMLRPLTGPPAPHNRCQSMAMVLLNENILKLS